MNLYKIKEILIQNNKMFYLILKPFLKIYYKMKDLSPCENQIYIIKKNTNYDITMYYYFVLFLYYMNINISKAKYDILVLLKNNKRVIYHNVLLNDVIIKNRIINNRHVLKKPYLFIKLSINGKQIDYNMKKLIFCHDENNTLDDIYKAYHFEKIEKIIVNNKEMNNNIQIKNLIIN
jgi:hypothetical protein